MTQEAPIIRSTLGPPVPAIRAAHLAARLGHLLFANGADTRHVSTLVTHFSEYLGHVAHVLVTPGVILVTVGTNEQSSTKVDHELNTPGVDMGRLAALNQLIDEVRHGILDATSIEQRLHAIEIAKNRYPDITVILGIALTAASLARLFGATWTVVAASFVAGFASMLLRRRISSLLPNQVALTFVVAVLSGLVAVFTLRLWPDQSPVLALTAAGMILVPGVPLINGIREVTSGDTGNGLGRLIGGTSLVLAIGFALYTVGFLTGADLPVNGGPGFLSIPQDLLFSGLAAVGFALLFNVPARAVPFCILAGMASHGLRTALELAGLTLPISSLLGAAAAGLIARLAADIHRVPAVVFAFPGVVAMIPGSYGFRAGIGGLQIMAQASGASSTLVATTLALAITTTVTTVAIAIGLSLSLPSSANKPSHALDRKD